MKTINHGLFKKQNLIYSLLGALTLSLYGWKVCPFIEQVSFWRLAVEFGVPLIIFSLIAGPGKSLKTGLFLDFGRYMVLAIILIPYYKWVHHFPTESALKIMVGLGCLGLFNGLDNMALFEREYFFKNQLRRDLDSHDYFPVTKKILLLVTGLFIFTTIIQALVLNKDMLYIFNNKESLTTKIHMSVMLDMFYTLGFLFLFSLRILFTFGQNLKVLFEFELKVLGNVNQGILHETVPVVSNDEFGIIAKHTNEMIAGLREKEKVKGILGKAVGGEVAKILMDQNQEDLLKGRPMKVAILFCDIRNFTTLSERMYSEEIVALLNDYFPAMSSGIEINKGVIDKFIGDAILAVFGLCDGSSAAEDAFKAAEQMLKDLKRFNTESTEKLEIGIGIHYGEVTSGIIGTPSRFEYTFIGDSVNVASRIEGKTKELKQSLLVSEEVFNHLPHSISSSLHNVGAHALKGKSKELQLYGLKVSVN